MPFPLRPRLPYAVRGTACLLALTLLLGTAPASAQIHEPDSLALVGLYNACGGPGWTHHQHWLDGPVATWHGVHVSGHRVVGLHLERNQLTGPIPPEIGNLNALQSLSLYLNPLTGPIPPEIGNLNALQSLQLSDSQLDGPIPPELGNLTALTMVELHNNALIGPIPATFGNLTNLRDLFLESNQLDGPLPPELGTLTRLEILTLHQNAFTGAIPMTFIDLVNLRVFTYNRTDLCTPPDPAFQAWLQGIATVNGTGVLCTPTAVDERPASPTAFALLPNYPNPFNPVTTLRYALPRTAAVRLAVYDLLGREVAVLAEATRPPGWYAVTFDAGPLPGGVYLARMEADAFVATRILTLLK